MISFVCAPIASMTFASRPRARRIEEDEVHLRESADLLLDRRRDHLHVLRHVHARVANGDGRALDHRHALEELRDRQGEEPDAAVEIDRGLVGVCTRFAWCVTRRSIVPRRWRLTWKKAWVLRR